MKRKAKHNRRRALIGVGIALALCVALETFLCVWFFGARYPRFDKIARMGETLPYLEEGIAPQGICALPENEGGYRFVMSGYMPKGKPSRLCLVGERTSYVTLTQDGTPLTTHFGGVTRAGETLLVASGNSVVCVPLAAVLSAEDGASVEVTGAVETDMGVAFCYYDEGSGLLFAGEFYRKGNYETDRSHRIERGEEKNPALVYVYEWEGSPDCRPVGALSVRGLVQGIAVNGTRIYLSCSYGLPDSALYVYENILGGAPAGSVSVSGAEVPLYFLGEEALLSALTMPCMSEEICLTGTDMAVLFESRAKKYRYFVRRQIKELVYLPLAALE